MPDTSVSETTQLLRAWVDGDPDALPALTARVYRELRRMAGAFVRNEVDGNTLQATALVHEVYVRLIEGQKINWEGRAHFFAICAQLMRRILVDQARKRSASKRGGGLGRIDLDELPDLGGKKDRQLLALDDALDRLMHVDPRKAKVVELRYFGGLSVQEAAAALKISEETITRDWRMARAWLLKELKQG